MAIHQTNAETSQSIKIDNLLKNSQVKADYVDLLNDNQIKILKTLEKLISVILQ